MKIKYLGHSSFLISGKDKTVVTDPFFDIGYDMERVNADFCTVSHEHFDHNAVNKVNATKIIRSTTDGFYEIESYHDDKGGALRGKNRIFKFTVDGFTVCHLGDLGEYFSSHLAEEIGKVDILFVPVGGVYTIDQKEAVVWANGIDAKIVIPMHYKTKSLSFELGGKEKFLKKMAGVEYVGREIEIENLPEDKTVYSFSDEDF